LLGLGCREFGLACEEVEVKPFLAKGDTLRELAETVLERFLGLLEFSLFQELVGALGNASVWLGTGDQEECQDECG
jgi:hypothetical protein